MDMSAAAFQQCEPRGGRAGPGPSSKDAFEKQRIALRQEAHTRYDPPETPLDQVPALNAARRPDHTSRAKAVDTLRAQTCAERERYQVRHHRHTGVRSLHIGPSYTPAMHRRTQLSPVCFHLAGSLSSMRGVGAGGTLNTAPQLQGKLSCHRSEHLLREHEHRCRTDAKFENEERSAARCRERAIRARNESGGSFNILSCRYDDTAAGRALQARVRPDSLLLDWATARRILQ